ncbi:hypothetical protein [Flavobacterium pectinovorum]|uniref:hypothetical protein n=1 Tax=Flavobacterium pectinovorum TaxID=29533 RepID=UPI001FAC54C5|nr:hypothetical protein [Flavobacterium pectinovorum]MCI9844874.1 hypothetical protein [Flavobacterium pectinovorum]
MIILVIVDFIALSIYTQKLKLDPSVAIGIIVIALFIFIVNILIAVFFLIFKKPSLTGLFVLNAFLASAISVYVFEKEMKKQSNLLSESWQFQKNDTVFSLTRWKKRNEFSMNYSLSPGSSSGFLDGKYFKENNSWILVTDSTKMKIENNVLIGFRKPADTIRMLKDE